MLSQSVISRIRCNLFTAILALIAVSANAQEANQAEVLARISKAKSELQTLETRVSQQSREFARKLDSKEQEIKILRDKAAAQQRLADEQLLGLDKLKERVDQWTTQNNYQKHLLAHYRDSVGLTNATSTQEEGAAATLTLAYTHLEASLAPAWQEHQVISPDGQVIQAQVLKLGPVAVALDQQSETSGLLQGNLDKDAYILDVFDGGAQSGLAELHAQKQGLIAFDPTLGNALQLLGQNENLWIHVRKGGVWAIPIIFFGVLSFAIAVLKSTQLIRLPQVDTELAEQLQKVAQDHTSGDTQELKQKLKGLIGNTGHAQQKLAQIALANPVSQQRDDLLVAYLMEHKHTLEKYMGIVATSAAIAPLLGLLGTVSGMITTFKMMTIFGSGDASTVSGGISEALVTTELGLIVAIPSLIVSALLSRRIKSYVHKLENFAIKLSKVRFKA